MIHGQPLRTGKHDILLWTLKLVPFDIHVNVDEEEHSFPQIRLYILNLHVFLFLGYVRENYMFPFDIYIYFQNKNISRQNIKYKTL